VNKCLLCGYVFEQGQKSCAGCPMSRGCQSSCCPNCGYALPPESSLVKLWRKVKSKKKMESETHAG